MQNTELSKHRVGNTYEPKARCYVCEHVTQPLLPSGAGVLSFSLWRGLERVSVERAKSDQWEAST